MFSAGQWDVEFATVSKVMVIIPLIIQGPCILEGWWTMFMIDGMNQQALGVLYQLFNWQDLQGLKKFMSVGIVGAFGDGSNNFFLDFTQFSYILLGGTSIDGEAVDKMRVHH